MTVTPATVPLSTLVVEEHREMRGALRAWLLTSFPPMRLCEACNMDEARRFAEQAALDLALVNLELPGPDGIEVARMLRSRQPSCRVVVMSVNDSTALRVAALHAGAYAFVSKRDLRLALHSIVSALIKAS
jgi:DNA-binding NarL/FixJ family response regulator